MRALLLTAAVLLVVATLWTADSPGAAILHPSPLPRADGYRGVWYFNQPSGDEYRYKYSGGFATYPQQHVPIAVYSKTADKTFFVYGGATRNADGEQELLHLVSYYDHQTGQVPRPAILLNKKTDDAHDNPTLTIDGGGCLWVFSNAHGTSRPAYIHKSRTPYAIDDFETVAVTNFSYGQPWRIAGRGLALLHTRYQEGRRLFLMTSPDGREWSEPQPIARVEKGHYQVSWPFGSRLGTMFNYHPEPVGLNARTNLYYLQTSDFGETWTNAAGEAVETPLERPSNAALVRDYRSDGLLVYLKDLNYDKAGRPVLLYLTSKGYQSGPEQGLRQWRTARWTGEDWIHRDAIHSDHNYDHGSLYIEPDGIWRIIAPADKGPQPFGTGGEMGMWISRDEGETWTRTRRLTQNSRFNHTYARRPLDAHPDFYALWADGDAFGPSESSLYFTNQDGDHVWRLPTQMDGEFARPEIVR